MFFRIIIKATLLLFKRRTLYQYTVSITVTCGLIKTSERQENIFPESHSVGDRCIFAAAGGEGEAGAVGWKWAKKADMYVIAESFHCVLVEVAVVVFPFKKRKCLKIFHFITPPSKRAVLAAAAA